MIADSRMVWPIQDRDSARDILRSIIGRTVIDLLVDSGILQTEYEPHRMLGGEFPELSTFRATPFGRGLLEAIDEMMRQLQRCANTSITNGRPGFATPPVHLCRLRYFGNDEWGFAFFTYSNEKYELSVSPNGPFSRTPEEAFLTSARVYLND
jgi:hypothetical protein